MCSQKISLNYKKRTSILLVHYRLTVSVLKIVKSYLYERQPVVNWMGMNAAHLIVRQQCASGQEIILFQALESGINFFC